MGVQHIAGLIAAGNQIVLGGLLAGGGIVHRNVFLVGILKVIRVEVVVGGVLVFTGGVGIQHGTLLGLDVVAAAVLSGEALGRGVQRGRGHNAVGGHGDIGDAVLDLDILTLLQVVVRDGGPDMQRVDGELQVRRLDGEGFLVLGVVDEHGGEVRLIGGSQRHVAGVAVDTGGLVLVVAGAEGAVGRIRQHTPDAVCVGVILPAGLGEFRNVAQHVEHGVIVDIAAPRVAGGQQLLVTVLDALIEGANRGLEHVHRAAGTDKGVGQAVQQRQRALVAADGAGTVLGGLVFLQFGIAEGRAALAVPDFLVVHVCHRDIIARGVGAVVEADSIDSVVHAGIAAHQGNDLQALIFVGGHDLDVVVGFLGFLGEVAGEVCLILQRVGKVFDDLAIGAAGLVLIGIDVVDDVTVLLVGVKDGFLIPFINGSVFLGAVGLGLDPVGILPAQDGDLDVRVDLLGVSSHDETRRAGGIGFLVLIALRAGLGAGGVVAVVAHLHLDVGEQRVIAAEQVLHHGPVGLRILGLVVQQQVAGGVAVQHAQALVGPAVDVLGSGLHVSAGDGDNTVHTGNAAEGIVAGRGLGLGSLGVSRAGDNDVVIQAGAHEAGAVGRAERADDAGLFAELEADAAGGQDLLAVQVNSDGALGVILVVDKGNRVPLPCRQVLGEGVLGAVVDLEHSSAVGLAGDDAEVGIRRGADQHHGGVVVLVVELEISVQREAGAFEEAVTVVDGSAAIGSGVAAADPAGGNADLLAAVQTLDQGRAGADADHVIVLQRLAEVGVVAIHGRVGGLGVAGALNSQPANGGGVLTGGRGRPGHDLLGGDLKLTGLGGNGVVVLLRNRRINRRTCVGGQAQIHGTVLAAPPLTVGSRDLVLTGGQRELVGDCLPCFIVFAVNTGVILVISIAAGVALRLGVGVHQAPGRVALVELVGLTVQQLVAQQRLGGCVGGSGLNIVHLVVASSGHAVDKVNGVCGDDLHGVLVACLILCSDGCIGLCEGIRGHIIRPIDSGRDHTDVCCDASRGGLRCSSLLRSGGCGLLGGKSLLNRGIHRGESCFLRRCFLDRRLLSRGVLSRGRGLLGSRLLRWGLCGDCVLRRSLLGGRRSLLDDGSHWLFVGRKGLRRDHAGQHTDTKSRREYALALVLCFSHSLHPFSLSSVCIMHKSTLQWFTTIIQAASVFPPCDNSRSSCTFSRTFPALRFQVESYKYYIFYFEIYMEFICLLSVYLYVKRYFRGKPQTSFGILISIGDTSRKEKRRYAICSAAFFIIDILCKFVYRRISAIFQFLVHHF